MPMRPRWALDVGAAVGLALDIGPEPSVTPLGAGLIAFSVPLTPGNASGNARGAKPGPAPDAGVTALDSSPAPVGDGAGPAKTGSRG